MPMKCLHSVYQQTTLIGNLQPSLLFLVVMKCWVLKKPALQECVASCLLFTYTVKLLFPGKAEQERGQDQKSIHWHSAAPSDSCFLNQPQLLQVNLLRYSKNTEIQKQHMIIQPQIIIVCFFQPPIETFAQCYKLNVPSFF